MRMNRINYSTPDLAIQVFSEKNLECHCEERFLRRSNLPDGVGIASAKYASQLHKSRAKLGGADCPELRDNED
jgi:hypothetical protein